MASRADELSGHGLPERTSAGASMPFVGPLAHRSIAQAVLLSASARQKIMEYTRTAPAQADYNPTSAIHSPSGEAPADTFPPRLLGLPSLGCAWTMAAWHTIQNGIFRSVADGN